MSTAAGLRPRGGDGADGLAAESSSGRLGTPLDVASVFQRNEAKLKMLSSIDGGAESLDQFLSAFTTKSTLVGGGSVGRSHLTPGSDAFSAAERVGLVLSCCTCVATQGVLECPPNQPLAANPAAPALDALEVEQLRMGGSGGGGGIMPAAARASSWAAAGGGASGGVAAGGVQASDPSMLGSSQWVAMHQAL